MSEMRDIVERLREPVWFSSGLTDKLLAELAPILKQRHEAAAAITSLRQRAEAAEKRVAELEAALRPFAAEFDRHREIYIKRGGIQWFDTMPKDWPCELKVTMAAGRAAAALAKGDAA